MKRVITLTSDFGTRDYYVGTMKGTILGIAPDVQIVDLSHDIAKQDITQAAIILRSSYRFFPEGTIHVAVVDPGVGGPRRPIVGRCGGQLFVGPDNGIFSMILEEGAEAWELRESAYRLTAVSDTFHGRAIFAPAAAHMSLGTEPDAFGPPAKDLVRLEPRQPFMFNDGIRGEVIYVDAFGNLVTNIAHDVVEKRSAGQSCRVELSGRVIDKMSRTYRDAPRGSLVAMFGSTNFLEIAIRDGNAHRKLGVGIGDPVLLSF